MFQLLEVTGTADPQAWSAIGSTTRIFGDVPGDEGDGIADGAMEGLDPGELDGLTLVAPRGATPAAGTPTPRSAVGTGCPRRGMR